MKLPNRKNAIIRREKLTKYLLSLTQPKAKFFRSIGFNEANIEKLEQALLQIGRSNEVTLAREERKIDKETLEVIKILRYDIIGLIDAPNGKQYKVRTGWAIKANEKIPYLVTAFPN